MFAAVMIRSNLGRTFCARAGAKRRDGEKILSLVSHQGCVQAIRCMVPLQKMHIDSRSGREVVQMNLL